MITKQNQFSPLAKFEETVRRVLLYLLPNLKKFPGPLFGRIVKVNFAGGKVDIDSKVFSAEIEILDADLAPDTDFENIKDVPIDGATFNDNGAVYAIPKVGTIVRVGFMYNDPGFPFIMSYTNEGKTLPAGKDLEFRIDNGKGIILEIDGEKINIKVAGYNTDLSHFIDNFLKHTHLGNTGAPTSPVSGSVPPMTAIDFNNGEL